MKLSILACLVVGSSAFVGPQKSTVSTLERKKERKKNVFCVSLLLTSIYKFIQ
jgi:hypothetical protein